MQTICMHPRWLILFVLFSWGAGASAQSYFLRVHGMADNSSDHSSLLREYSDLVVEPLERGKKFALYSYNFKIDGTGFFTFNLALEPLDSESLPLFQKYMRMIATKTFYDIQLIPERITGLKQTASLQSGNYVADADDPFVMNFETVRKYDFPDLKAWLDFSSYYGFALLSTDSARVRTFVRDFLPLDSEFAEASAHLKKSNMMAILPVVEIVLESGEVIPGDMDNTPFIPFKFFRNCYDSKFEGGNCF